MSRSKFTVLEKLNLLEDYQQVFPELLMQDNMESVKIHLNSG